MVKYRGPSEDDWIMVSGQILLLEKNRKSHARKSSMTFFYPRRSAPLQRKRVDTLSLFALGWRTGPNRPQQIDSLSQRRPNDSVSVGPPMGKREASSVGLRWCKSVAWEAPIPILAQSFGDNDAIPLDGSDIHPQIVGELLFDTVQPSAETSRMTFAQQTPEMLQPEVSFQGLLPNR